MKKIQALLKPLARRLSHGNLFLRCPLAGTSTVQSYVIGKSVGSNMKKSENKAIIGSSLYYSPALYFHLLPCHASSFPTYECTNGLNQCKTSQLGHQKQSSSSTRAWAQLDLLCLIAPNPV